MEILVKENRAIRDSELFFFEQGFLLSDGDQLEYGKTVAISMAEKQLFEVFNFTSEEFEYDCQSSVDLDDIERKRIAKRILYHIRCRDSGSHEFVLCTNRITKKEIFVKYVNGHFQGKLTPMHLKVLFERKSTHFFRIEIDKYQMIGYTMNVGLDMEILTKPIFSQLVQDDIKKRVSKLFAPAPKKAPAQLPFKDCSYSTPVIKRFNDVIALSDFLVVSLEIKRDSYVLLRELKEEIFVSFLNLDDEVFDIHLKVNSTRYARRSFIDSNIFPLIIYLKYVSRVDLFSSLEDEIEYEIDLEPKYFEGNVWYQILNM